MVLCSCEWTICSKSLHSCCLIRRSLNLCTPLYKATTVCCGDNFQETDAIVRFNFYSLQENRSKLVNPARQQNFTNSSKPMAVIQTVEELPSAKPVAPSLTKAEEFLKVKESQLAISFTCFLGYIRCCVSILMVIQKINSLNIWKISVTYRTKQHRADIASAYMGWAF